MKNNRFCIFLLSLIYMMLLSGCGEQICSYCGESKQCGEYDILGTTRYICEDCLGDRGMSLSGNVIGEYESPLVDPSLYLPYNVIVEDGPAVETVSDNNVSVVIPDSESMNGVSDNQSQDTSGNVESNSSSNTSYGKENLVSTVASNLSAVNFLLQPDDDVKDKYHIYKDGNVTGISISFSGESNGTKVGIAMKNGASDQNFADICIYTGLACLGSADYDNYGVAVFNSARDHGNYTKDNCRFYYMDELDASTNDGAIATYEIHCE